MQTLNLGRANPEWRSESYLGSNQGWAIAPRTDTINTVAECAERFGDSSVLMIPGLQYLLAPLAYLASFNLGLFLMVVQYSSLTSSSISMVVE